ncbi:MAG: four helix bundle protein [Bdellovibrionota bacterium]
MKNFRTFRLAVEFYQLASKLKVQQPLRNQLDRAASSIALNLAEGRGKRTTKDQVRFFSIAMGSLRECQAVLILAELENHPAWEKSDDLGAHLYRLIQNAR